MLRPEKSPFIAVARIIRPQGRRGEVSAEMVTDFPERFENLREVFLAAPRAASDTRPQAVALEKAWPHRGRIVLKLGGVDSIGQAEGLRGFSVMIPYEDRVKLPSGSYYTSELEGCRVVTGPPGARVEVGTVAAVEPTGGVPLLRVIRQGARGGANEILIPLAQEICREIDPDAGVIVIDPPGDLLELNSSGV